MTQADFTRFGRNSIEVGYFLERVFPLYGVRFISLGDGFDSAQLHGDTGGLNVAFKYLMGEFYSRDLSIKYKSAKYVRFKRGEYQSVLCPYGYQKGSDGRMEPDEKTASNVRLIFELAQEGQNYHQIVRELYERRIPTPGEYKAAKGVANHDVSRCNGIWQTSTVQRILTDERYIGTYIMGRRVVKEVGSHQTMAQDEREWIKIPNHHPAIISRELFERVQDQLPRAKCVKKNAHIYPLRSKVFCGHCLHAMSRTSSKNPVFYCRHSDVDKGVPCHGIRIREAELEATLYEILSSQAHAILNLPDLSNVGVLDVELAKQADYAKRIAELQDQKRVLYEQFLLREISMEDYSAGKSVIDGELTRLKQAHAALSSQTAQMRMDDETRAVRKKLAKKIDGANTLTQELADTLIDRVNVYPGNQIEVIWKMKDFCVE